MSEDWFMASIVAQWFSIRPEVKGPWFETHRRRCIVCLFVVVALRPMSTAMVIVGRSVHLTTLFPGQA